MAEKHQVRKACQLCRSIIEVRKVPHALSKRLCCRDTCIIRVGIKLRWGINVNSFRYGRGSPFVCLQGAQRRQSKEFNLSLHLQRWLWSSGMSQERWQAGQCVNLPFNRPSRACLWPNSQSWQRIRNRKKTQREYCQIKSKRGNLIGMPWLPARTLTLLANLPGKSFILLKAGDKFCQALPVLIIHLLLFLLLCKRRGLRAAQKKYSRLSKSIFHGLQGLQRKLPWRFCSFLVGQKCKKNFSKAPG